MLTQPLEHLKSIQLGQTKIQNQQAKAVALQRFVSRRAVRNMIHRVARLRQRKAQRFRQSGVVFSDENSHSRLREAD